MQLSLEAFDRARTFVKAQARPLDQRLFEFYFEEGAAAAVLAELAHYQNDDGGFGHSLEPDFRLVASSPLATTVAFQVMREVEATADHPLVQSGIRYFLNNYDPERQGWLTVPPAVNDVPHAPWWTHHDSGPADAAAQEQSWGNPNAEIVGYLHEYAEWVPADLLAQLTGKAMANLAALPDPMGGYILMPFLRLAETLPEPTHASLVRQIRHRAGQTLPLDPAKWANDHVRLHWFIPSPTSPLFKPFQEALARSLDYEIQQQTAEGCWAPMWQWGQYEESWLQAEREWKGHLTVKTLRALQNFGRIL